MRSKLLTIVGSAVIAASVSAVTMSSPSVAQDFASIRKANEDSVVFLHSRKMRKDGVGAPENSFGTGFIISRDCHVLSASHVVFAEDDDSIVETTASLRTRYGHRYPLRIIKRDHEVDVILMLLPPDIGIECKPVARGDSRSVPRDAVLYTLGFPGASDMAPATGLLSHKFGPRGTWQTTLPINRGNSGGPVFDISGRFVAIASAGEDFAQQITYAIPEAYATGVIQLAQLNYLKWQISYTSMPVGQSGAVTDISKKFTFYKAVGHDGEATAREQFCLPEEYAVTNISYGIATVAGDGTRLIGVKPDASKKNCVTFDAFIKGRGVSRFGPIVVDYKGRGWLGVDVTIEGKIASKP